MEKPRYWALAPNVLNDTQKAYKRPFYLGVGLTIFSYSTLSLPTEEHQSKMLGMIDAKRLILTDWKLPAHLVF